MQSISPRLTVSLCVGFVLTMLVSLGSFAVAQTCVELPSGIIAWRPMDETSGTTVADIAVNNPGIHVNGSVPAAGRVGEAFRFDGSNDFVEVGDTDSDGDGVLEANDACLATLPGEVVDDTGCSIDELCPCENAWKNQGAYVSCVTHAAEDFVVVADDLITSAEKDAIVAEAAESNCGKKP